MSRFKEGRRIAGALESGNSAELEWARWYCQSRIKFARRKDALKHWSALFRKVECVLGEKLKTD